MKQEERTFLFELLNSKKTKTPREIINTPGFRIPYKRAWYFLEKWADRGLYEYGVTLDLGWLTEKGKELAEQSHEPVKAGENGCSASKKTSRSRREFLEDGDPNHSPLSV